MRKIVIAFVVPEEFEKDYSDVCTELVVDDFIGPKDGSTRIGFEVISDSGWPTDTDRSKKA